MKLCSMCLLGVNCKYNGKNNANKKVIALSRKEMLIPVCPEQLAGLTTPREPAELRNGKAITASGKDVTKQMKKGAFETLKIAKMYKAKEAILKARSPSCGFGEIYDGTFSGRAVKGSGITADLLSRNGLRIISEEGL